MLKSNIFGYAEKIKTENPLDSYYIGEFNNKVYSEIYDWIAAKDQSILIISGDRGVGKSHCLAAAFNALGEESVKYMSGELILGLLTKKISSLDSSYDEDEYRKTFESNTSFIVIDNIDFVMKVLCLSSIKSLFQQIINGWIESGISIVFTSAQTNFKDDEYSIEKFLKCFDILIVNVKLEMPVEKTDMEAVIKKILFNNNSKGFDSKKFYEVLDKSIRENEELEENLKLFKDEIFYDRQREDYILSEDELNLLAKGNYNSINEMYLSANKLISDREKE